MAADPPIILHVGMHRTGTSSIQRSLYFGLEDPAFRLVSLGFPNAANYLMPLVGEDPADFRAFRAQGFPPARDGSRLADGTPEPVDRRFLVSSSMVADRLDRIAAGTA